MEGFNPDEFRGNLGDLLQNFAPMREAVLGYKNGLVMDGFEEAIAQHMAIEFHRYLMALCIAKITEEARG